jgi:precorrin-6Y C5,15-methyltransferase (decarboxylating)
MGSQAKYAVIGITDSRHQWFPPEVMEVIKAGKVFSGGKRHHEIMRDFLPENAVWIDITVPLSDVFKQYEQYDDIVVFASGDPLFFGFANTIQRECPGCEMKVYPSFNSLQMLAHRMCLPYHDMHVVSLTGRPWDKFDEALINGEPLIGVLTDKKNTPQAIWQRMQDYGYTNYKMTVGENLGNEETERIYEVDNNYQLSNINYQLNCLILQRQFSRPRPFGIPESAFHLLDGRAKMITKMPIRLISLSLMQLRERKTMWDVGFCTGSVSIEAKLQFPHLKITAFEVREEGRELMEINSRKFGVPGIETVIGDFLQLDLSGYPKPDAVFIGGHGGRLPEMMKKIYQELEEGGVIVMNTVVQSSYDAFMESAKKLGMKLEEPVRIALDDFNPITILKATK